MAAQFHEILPVGLGDSDRVLSESAYANNPFSEIGIMVKFRGLASWKDGFYKDRPTVIFAVIMATFWANSASDTGSGQASLLFVCVGAAVFYLRRADPHRGGRIPEERRRMLG